MKLLSVRNFDTDGGVFVRTSVTKDCDFIQKFIGYQYQLKRQQLIRRVS